MNNTNIILIVVLYLSTCMYLVNGVGTGCPPSTTSNTPSVTLASSKSNCLEYDTLTVSNPNLFTSLIIDGVIPSADPATGNLVFNFLQPGAQVLSYSFSNPNNAGTQCTGTVPFTAVVRSVQLSAQPKCPWNMVPFTVVSDTSPTWTVNAIEGVLASNLSTTKPGSNMIIGSTCTYYFEVMPLSDSVPSIAITPNTCGKNDSSIKVINYTGYSSIKLVSSTTQAIFVGVNGTFGNLPADQYVLQVNSTTCGPQYIPLTLTSNSPTVQVTTTPVPCSSTSNPSINVTFSVPGLNPIYSINGIAIVGNTTTITQDTSYSLTFVDSATGCSGAQGIVIPSVVLPVSVSIDPPISTYSQQSIMTISYPGSYTDLTVNGNPINSSFQYVTFTNTTDYSIQSSCYNNQIDVNVPVLTPQYIVTPGSCFAPASITVINYRMYSNITLSTEGAFYWSTNGSFPNITATTYFINATEKTTGSIVPKSYTASIAIPTLRLNVGLLSTVVDYITLASTCKKNDGLVQIALIYNNTIVMSKKNYTYTPNVRITIPFGPYCTTAQDNYIFYPPLSQFNFTYKITNSTGLAPANITITTDPLANLTSLMVNRVDVTGQPGPFPMYVAASGITNNVQLGYSDGCAFNFYPLAYSPPPTISPDISIYPQFGNSCSVATGKIVINNFGAFNQIQVTQQMTQTPGTYSNLASGIYTISYNVNGTYGTMDVFVPTSDVTVSQTIIQPSCSSANFPPHADSYVNFQLASSTGTPIPSIASYSPLTFTTFSITRFFTATNQLVGNQPGNYSGLLVSSNCKWLVNFTVPDYTSITLQLGSTKTKGANSGIVYVTSGIPSNRYLNPIESLLVHDASNYNQFTNLANRNGTVQVFAGYDTMCQATGMINVDFAYQVQPYYQITASTKCGSSIVTFSDDTFANYNIRVNGLILTTTSIELLNGQYWIYYTNINTFDQRNQKIQVTSIPSQTIDYTYVPGSCYNSQDGRVVINNPDPTFLYTLWDDNNGYYATYNNVTHSFDNLSGSAVLQLVVTQLNSQGLVVCTISNFWLETYDLPISLTPMIHAFDSCDTTTKGMVVISAANSSDPISGTFIINGTTYTNTSIDLPNGYYVMTIPSFVNSYCSINASQATQVYSFTIKQATEITVQQIHVKNDSCQLIRLQGSGGSSQYTFKLYDQSNFLMNTTSSDSNGQATFTVSSTSGTFKVVANDQSSCKTSSTTINIDCTLSSSSSISSSFIMIISLISLLFFISF